ncbi:phosphoribosylaminoimidazolesuccinocarboxamide synthase [Mycetocola manganoxydans]|uniref:Phosphoribosylaminoimidazole-succinocarboxamide synthase n=1 Tax=Mycetocola manganoxydans TaxID=699879 RepID=A0A3L6ZYU4_9MICO|nr:phosphoribosylaminoimidazolesuccinocarboxamide synthase [Mycetocola manganoxydans]GHD45143.1 phosphoribosylaminoimidazole-succinocarboxamide synthase [Mycetocola manganoxydans]
MGSDRVRKCNLAGALAGDRTRDNGGVSTSTNLPGWTHLYSGKVRDLYERPDDSDALLVVASDRVSAFDHVLSPGIPGKGELLTALSLWWFDRLDVPNHLLAEKMLGDDDTMPGLIPAEVAGRAMLVKKLEMFPVECVVRGYLTGSGWKEYVASRSVCGIPLPDGLQNGDRLPEPLYTPAYKAPMGEHDENISFEQSIELVGEADATALRDTSLAIYAQASAIAEERGVILADTKFEFGRDPVNGVLTLGDEVLTSDSSRYWDADIYATAGTAEDRMASFDKQIVRDWLAANWDQVQDPPELPNEIVEETTARYRELLERLTA